MNKNIKVIVLDILVVITVKKIVIMINPMTVGRIYLLKWIKTIKTWKAIMISITNIQMVITIQKPTTKVMKMPVIKVKVEDEAQEYSWEKKVIDLFIFYNQLADDSATTEEHFHAFSFCVLRQNILCKNDLI